MAHKTLGKHYRKGIMLIEITAMFPRRCDCRKMVRETTLVGLHLLSALQLCEYPSGRKAQDDGAPLPRLSEALFGENRHHYGIVQSRISGVGAGDVSVADWAQRPVEPKAAPRLLTHDRVYQREVISQPA